MHLIWSKSQEQILLPAGPSRKPRRTTMMAALLSCIAIFLVDLLIPGVVVGFLYNLVVVGLGRVGHVGWLIALCLLSTIFHAVAGVYDLAAAELGVVLANRGLAIVVLWGIGATVALRLDLFAARKPRAWVAVGR